MLAPSPVIPAKDLAMPLQCAKILATIGPGTANPDTLKALIQAGARAIRLNMSHGDQPTHKGYIDLIRQVEAGLGIPIAILADLQGPKLRTGTLKDHEPILLVPGQRVTMQASKEPGYSEDSGTLITTPSADLMATLEIGGTVLINDGALRLTVVERVDTATIICEVKVGGPLSERKGINVPDSPMSLAALTEKDKGDAIFAVNHGADFLALSFVRSASDIEDLKTFLTQQHLRIPPIIAKIEKPQALTEIDAILKACWGLMVARGDLGVELSAKEVPIVQKNLIARANQFEKPVIVATQMLESMILAPTPTRAEVSDVANAIFDGADAVMLSAESATGQYPCEAVRTMSEVVTEAEKHFHALQRRPHDPSTVPAAHFHHTIAHAASYAAMRSPVSAIVVLSESGRMAQRLSKLKPNVPIIAITESLEVWRKMALLWGVTPLMSPYADTTEEMINQIESLLFARKLLKTGDSILFCAGMTPILGATDMLKFFTLGSAVRSGIGLL